MNITQDLLQLSKSKCDAAEKQFYTALTSALAKERNGKMLLNHHTLVKNIYNTFQEWQLASVMYKQLKGALEQK